MWPWQAKTSRAHERQQQTPTKHQQLAMVNKSEAYMKQPAASDIRPTASVNQQGAHRVLHHLQQPQVQRSPPINARDLRSLLSPQHLNGRSAGPPPSPLPPMCEVTDVDPMDDGGDDDVDLLDPEEEALVAVREFGKRDRMQPGKKQLRLQELNADFPTRNQMQSALDGLQSSAVKGLMEMAIFVHDQIQELIDQEQAEKTSKVRFIQDPNPCDGDAEESKNPKDDDNEASTDPKDDDNEAGQTQDGGADPRKGQIDGVAEENTKLQAQVNEKQNGPSVTTTGILLEDKPESLGYPKLCIVSGTVPGSPAYFSGKIKPRDLIMQVDDEDVTINNFRSTIRGNDQPGSQIKILVNRVGRKRPFVVHLTRDHRETVSQKHSIIEMLACLAPGPSFSSGDPAREDENAMLHQEILALLKKVERGNFEDKIILRDEIDRKIRILQRAQILILEFMQKAKELSSIEPNPSYRNQANDLLEGASTADVSVSREAREAIGEAREAREAGSPNDEGHENKSELPHAVGGRADDHSNTLEDLCKQLQEHCIGLDEQNERLQHKLKMAEDEITELREKLSQTEECIAQELQNSEYLKKTIASLTETVESNENERSKAAEQIKDVKNELASLEGELAEARSARLLEKSKVESLTASLQGCEEALVEARKRSNAFAQKNDDLSAMLEEANAQFQALDEEHSAMILEHDAEMQTLKKRTVQLDKALVEAKRAIGVKQSFDYMKFEMFESSDQPWMEIQQRMQALEDQLMKCVEDCADEAVPVT